MTPDLSNLLAQIKRSSARSKAVAALCAVALAAVLGVAGFVAAQPHFTVLYSGLEDDERVAVEKALAGGALRFRVSQPPAPFVVYVDEAHYYDAQNAVALAGALERAPTGIHVPDASASSIFLSSGERQQGMLKREWQELERQLETLDFIARATVTTSTPETSPLRPKASPTVSVTLKLRRESELSREQANNVAKLVRFRFNVPADHVVISDQSGRTLHDASEEDGVGGAGSLLEHSASYDKDLALRANRTLELAFGPRKALVTVASEWDHDQRTIVAETVDPKGVVISQEKTTTRTPQGSLSSSGATGGPAGTASNLAVNEFGIGNAAPGASSSSAAAAPSGVAADTTATTSEERKVFDTGKTRTQTVHTAPELRKLYVSLMLDESLAPKKEEVSQFVKNAVGFNETRDSFSAGTTTFAGDGVAADGNGQPASGNGGPSRADPASNSSPFTELLVRRSVEIVSAATFVFLLFWSLKGRRRDPSRAGNAAEAAGGEAAVDPELLARAQVDELVRSDPRRVGEILSRWAGEEAKAARTGR